MKILTAIVEFIIKAIAGSIVWLIVAVVLSFPLGLILLKISDRYITNNEAFYHEISHEIELLFFLFVTTSFVGIITARVVAVSIKTLADKKLTQKSQKS